MKQDCENTKVLFVGDPHATVDELSDCERLNQRIIEVVKKEQPELLVFLGDQHHNHAVVRVEVIDFWRKSYRAILEAGKYGIPGKNLEIFCLVGNHDKPGDSSSKSHAMQAYEDLVLAVDKPMYDFGMMFLPYYHNPEDFYTACNREDVDSIQTVVCHQTFDGGKYENGFYAKDGLLLDKIPQKYVISGHIHSPQSFGKVWYPGAPRWRISSDANTDRAIWVVEFKDGIPVKKTPYDMRGYCREIIEVEDREGIPNKEIEFKQPCLVTASIYGSKAYVDERKVYWQAQGARVRAFTIEVSAPKVRESEGIGKALNKFVSAYKPKFGTSLERIQKMVAERVHV